MTDTFNEVSLGEAIAEKWGRHGAHYDVFVEMLRRCVASEDDAVLTNILRRMITDMWWDVTNTPTGPLLRFDGNMILTDEEAALIARLGSTTP